jgi:hypothetical protein
MQRIRANLVAALAVSITVFVFLPLVVYALNLDSTDVRSATLLLGGLVVSFFTATALFLLCFVPGLGPVVRPACQALALVCFVLIAFPNHTGEIAGFHSEAAGWAPIVKLTALLGLALALVVWCPRLSQTATAFILFFAAAATIGWFLLPSAQASKRTVSQERDALTGLGSRQNVIVIVLDAFTGWRMAEVFAEKPSLVPDFAGFTLYPRAIASALNTPAGLSTILTGDLDVAINTPGSGGDRITRALSQSFLVDATKVGFDSVFLSALAREPVPGISSLYDNQFLVEEPPIFRSYLGFWLLSLRRVLPSTVAMAISEQANAALIKVSIGSSNVDLYKRLPWGVEAKTLGSKIAFEYFLQNVHVGPDAKKAIFIHSNLAHPPYMFDENGRYTRANSWETVSYYAANSLSRLFDRLRQIGIYDSALIIVVSDHGFMPVRDSSMGGLFKPPVHFDPAFNPLLMVKPPNARYPLQESQRTVWLGDVAATVRDFVGAQTNSKTLQVGSLMTPQLTDDREVDVPVFYRPNEESYWSSLMSWARHDFKGKFSDCTVDCSMEAVPALREGSLVTVSAGSNQSKGGYTDSIAGDDAWARVNVDNHIAARIRKTGIVAVKGSGSEVKWYTFSDVQKGLQFVQELGPGDSIVAAGLEVPTSIGQKFFSEAQAWPRDEEKKVNFVYVFQPGSMQLPLLRVDTGEVNQTVTWH